MLLYLFPVLFPTHWHAHEILYEEVALWFYRNVVFNRSYHPLFSIFLPFLPPRQLVVSSWGKTTQLDPKLTSAFSVSDLMSTARKDNSYRWSSETSAGETIKITALLNQLQGSKGQLWVLGKCCDKANLE